MPYYSLVIATLGESLEDLKRCIKSIEANEAFNGEVIIIYQGTGLGYKTLLNNLNTNLVLKIIHSESKGLSKARNLGIKHSNNKTTCFLFPDDDCYYPKLFFKKLTIKINNDKSDRVLFLGSVYDPVLSRSAIRKKWPNKISFQKRWKWACSITIFYKCSKDKIQLWDESLGLGAEYPSGEDTYYSWQIHNDKTRIIYDPNLCVYHPYKAIIRSEESYYRFGLGQGRKDKLIELGSNSNKLNLWILSKWFLSVGKKRYLRKALKNGYLKGYFGK